ncbi:DEAD/DEAH box helicase family protein [Bradyrhizobium japonicum]|uniref:DEAD/DEAH box helicase family protein n=1 Tax=Bradyrhizobium japonicum TaxID=375 RepID=UPI0035174072
MIDFKKRLAGKKVEKPVDPVKLYATLDREHDKGPLRPAQENVLKEWFQKRQSDRDVIVKLHTGQGKTLIGLLMLQSRLNAGHGPVVYLCPNNFLIEQTEEQARQFGIKTCSTDADLPDSFLNSETILVTSVQKLFNGLTKFGIGRHSTLVDTLLMDDAHACADIIRDQARIRIPSDEPAYSKLKALFASELEQQGAGTFADIENDKRDAFLPVPYWAWLRRESEIAGILSADSDRKSVKFAWPLLKDKLLACRAVLSGTAVEIEPILAPLEAFGSYAKAKHRIFMSATVTDDAFLIKGLQLEAKTIRHPLTYSKETWSGEKMILLPTLMHEDLNRGEMIASFAKPDSKRKFGRVVLAPSFARAADWTKAGAVLAEGDKIAKSIDRLRKGQFEHTVVLANRYDGIDLPDSSCRILVFDSRPFSENLIDLHQESCRPNSEMTLVRTVRTVEQGMGRSVRGEKDYSVIIVIGTDLVRLLRDKHSREFLSSQMQKQIEIGLDITELAKEEIQSGTDPKQALASLMKQCLGRDDGWKAFYVEKMDEVTPGGPSKRILEIYAAELEAEQDYLRGNYSAAVDRLQSLVDSKTVEKDDAGWYLQECARYYFSADRSRSEELQIAAHKRNRLLLKPPTGVTVTRLTLVSHGRAERLRKWISSFDAYSDLNVRVSDILGRLAFGVKADTFEAALDDLSEVLGFKGERPDKEWKEGPDNLWALDDKQYILFECKSEVDVKRAEVNKREAEQMNRSSAWFDKHYAGFTVKCLMVHPAGKIESAASLTHEVEGVREADLKRLTRAVQQFFKSFESRDLKDLSVADIQKLLNSHELQVSDLTSKYSRKLKDMK